MLRVAFLKSNRLGLRGITEEAIKLWERGLYSHCEMVFSDGLCGSALWTDGGVRLGAVDLETDEWDYITLPDYLEADARKWFEAHIGKAYDFWGDARFILPIIPSSVDTWFCSRCVADSLGIRDAYRYEPNVLYSALEIFNRKAP